MTDEPTTSEQALEAAARWEHIEHHGRWTAQGGPFKERARLEKERYLALASSLTLDSLRAAS